MQRGDVIELDDGGGVLLAVIVQSPALDGLSSLLVAPLSEHATPTTFRPQVSVAGRALRALVELTGPVDRTRIGENLGRLGDEDLWAVNLALVAVLDLQ